MKEGYSMNLAALGEQQVLQAVGERTEGWS
jgi:hypothetical protein